MILLIILLTIYTIYILIEKVSLYNAGHKAGVQSSRSECAKIIKSQQQIIRGYEDICKDLLERLKITDGVFICKNCDNTFENLNSCPLCGNQDNIYAGERI